MSRSTLHYSPEFNLSLLGIEKLHPFDTGKSGKALSALRGRLGNDVVDSHIELVTDEAVNSDLLLVHSREYLTSLSRSSEVARILELPASRRQHVITLPLPPRAFHVPLSSYFLI